MYMVAAWNVSKQCEGSVVTKHKIARVRVVAVVLVPEREKNRADVPSIPTITQVTIPANHSSVALLKLAQLPYNGATSLFIRVLLNKKYALPYKVSTDSEWGLSVA